MFNKDHLQSGHPYLIRDNILMEYVMDNKVTFETTVPLRIFISHVPRLAHDELGHNGTTQTYMIPKRLYYQKGLKPVVHKCKRQCRICQQRNR